MLVADSPRSVDFWFDFASTYSYLSAVRIATLAADRGVTVAWRPFLLGPIFKAQGWPTSPFNLYPAKGRYMVRDITRVASQRGLAFRLPDLFPQNSLLAARVALAINEPAARASFARAVFEAEFAGGADISSRDEIARCLALVAARLALASVDIDDVLADAGSERIKRQLRVETELAAAAGIFGAPSFVTGDGELYWGDDRLEAAIEHAARNAT